MKALEGAKSKLDFINEVGIVIFGIVAMVAIILILLLLKVMFKKLEKVQEIVSNVAKTLMWGSVIRMLI